MHVREQIAHGIVAHLRGNVPGLDDRIYKDGSVGWDRETFPWAVVKTGASRVSIEAGSADGLQLREMDVGIEVHDLNLLGSVDYVAKLGDAAVAIEARMANGLRRAVGISDCELTGDSGVQDIDVDARGVHAGVGLTFAIQFYTEVGDAGSLVTGA